MIKEQIDDSAPRFWRKQVRGIDSGLPAPVVLTGAPSIDPNEAARRSIFPSAGVEVEAEPVQDAFCGPDDCPASPKMLISGVPSFLNPQALPLP